MSQSLGWCLSTAATIVVGVAAVGRAQPAEPPKAPPIAEAIAPAPSQAPSGGAEANDLSSQATDPTASLMSFNLINNFTTSYHGLDDSGYMFKFQPVVPFRAWRTSNILRVVVPYQINGPGERRPQERHDLRPRRPAAEVGAVRASAR